MVILGSTGSIGVNALSVARQFGLEIEALVCDRNTSLLEKQIQEFKPRLVGIGNMESKLEKACAAKVFLGKEGICELLSLCESKRILNAVVGFEGLAFSLKALELGLDLLLANKESLVVAGKLIQNTIKKQCKESKLIERIFPLDSEHFSLWYLLENQIEAPRALCITASGGALRDMPLEKLGQASLDDALKHPTWKMGKKITIDSATLVNKLYEVLEAYWLFDTKKIDALIERSSLAHALVQFPSGMLEALLSPPDMRLPIAFGLDYQRAKNEFRLEALDIQALTKLKFEAIDLERYPLWRYKDLLLENPALGLVLNASNELVQNLFLQGRVPFRAFDFVISKCLERFQTIKAPRGGLEEILDQREEVMAYAKIHAFI